MSEFDDSPPVSPSLQTVGKVRIVSEEFYAEHERMRDLLRWRDAEKERPTVSGWYSVTFKGLPESDYYHIEEGWCRPLRFWRPIGEMPGGKANGLD